MVPGSSTGTSIREAEVSYAKAAKAELNREFDKAFRLYIKSAEDFLHISGKTADHTIRTTCKTQAAKALERAEKIRAIKNDLTPVLKDRFSEQQQTAILRKSAMINKTLYPMWDDAHLPISDSATLVQPSLSPEQLRHAAVWRNFPPTQFPVYSTDYVLEPEDIIQHVVSDCSLCASVAICLNYDRRFGTKLTASMLYPQNNEGIPVSSTDHRYTLKFLFNGEFRRVKIDDKLPCYPDGSFMCMSAGVKRQLLPCLIEKAYMKLMGGYDFPGSNSSIDVHTLIGWIPDHVEMKSSHFERERTWKRIMDGFSAGLCILSLGTGQSSVTTDALPFDLLPAHCYAVIGVREDGSTRLVTILDSWVPHTEKRYELSELSMDQLTIDDRATGRARSYDIHWDTVCDLFEGIYLSWNPSLFNHQLTVHSTWEMSNVPDQPRHSQFILKSPHISTHNKKTDIWVLLTRHVTDTTQDSEFISLSAESRSFADSNAMYLKGAFTNSTHVLTKATCTNADNELSLVASYDGCGGNVGFTITAYSADPLSWVREQAELPFNETVSGAFTSKTAGGNPTFPTFMSNPQYRLCIAPDKSGNSATTSNGRAQKAIVELTVHGERKIPYNLTAVWSRGERITELSRNDVALTSGAYTYGFATAKKLLPVGEYTLVVSSFEPQHTGTFSLIAQSSNKVELIPIPQEGAGMFSKVIQDRWAETTAAGGPSFKRYTSNPTYQFQVQSNTQVKIRLQIMDTNRNTLINVTLFQLTDKNTLGPHLATSGPYSDSVSGVITPQVTLQPGNHVIVPSTYNPGIEASFRLIVYSSSSTTVSRIKLSSA
ncbi:peptidase C2 family protein [Abortiporus biennis]